MYEQQKADGMDNTQGYEENPLRVPFKYVRKANRHIKRKRLVGQI